MDIKAHRMRLKAEADKTNVDGLRNSENTPLETQSCTMY